MTEIFENKLPLPKRNLDLTPPTKSKVQSSKLDLTENPAKGFEGLMDSMNKTQDLRPLSMLYSEAPNGKLYAEKATL